MSESDFPVSSVFLDFSDDVLRDLEGVVTITGVWETEGALKKSSICSGSSSVEPWLPIVVTGLVTALVLALFGLPLFRCLSAGAAPIAGKSDISGSSETKKKK